MAVRSTSKETVVSPWATTAGSKATVNSSVKRIDRNFLLVLRTFFFTKFASFPQKLVILSIRSPRLLLPFPLPGTELLLPPFPTGDAYRAPSCRSFPGRFALSINTVVSFLLSMVCIIDHLTMFVNENSDNKKSICL